MFCLEFRQEKGGQQAVAVSRYKGKESDQVPANILTSTKQRNDTGRVPLPLQTTCARVYTSQKQSLYSDILT